MLTELNIKTRSMHPGGCGVAFLTKHTWTARLTTLAPLSALSPSFLLFL